MARDPHEPTRDDALEDDQARTDPPGDDAERPADAADVRPDPATGLQDEPDELDEPAAGTRPPDDPAALPGAGDATAGAVPTGPADPGAPDAGAGADPVVDEHDEQHGQDEHDGDGEDDAPERAASDRPPAASTDGHDELPAAAEDDEATPQPADAGSEPPATTGAIGTVGRHGTPTQSEPRGLSGLGRALRPRASRSQIVVGVLCALLGFALVAQVSQTQGDQLSSLRQSDLVRLLDDVTQRSGELEDQVSSLEATRDELQSGSGRERAALELAEQQAETLGILSGRLPAQGPGIEIEIVEGGDPLDAFGLFNVLEELRNAGAEAMEVNGVRLVANSYFEDTSDGIVVDGQPITSPYRWTVIGDPSTLETALEIPGGAMASLRADGARTTIQQQDVVEVTATVEPGAPQYATPVPADD